MKTILEPDRRPPAGLEPVLGVSMTALTVCGIALSALGKLPVIRWGVLRLPVLVLGVFLILCAARMWALTVPAARATAAAPEGRLVTAGVHAWARCPICSALLFACTGVLLIWGNAALLVLPPVMWMALTAAAANTGEKRLEARFGREYEAYRRRVNRCIPRPPRK